MACKAHAQYPSEANLMRWSIRSENMMNKSSQSQMLRHSYFVLDSAYVGMQEGGG